MQQEERPSSLQETRIFGRTLAQLAVQLTALALLLVLVFQNTNRVEIDFIFWTINTRLIWALLASAGLGFLIGVFRLRYRRIR
jgi:uncharacterized integral membrane protein